MAHRKNKVDPKESSKVSEKFFESSDHKGETQLEKGMAETHEQVEDDYFEGTIDQKTMERKK